MTKNIKELTENEAKEILKFVYPENKDNYFTKLSLEPVISEDGKQRVTFDLRPLVGIEYYNGQDNCILHFDNTRAVLWLYKNGYDITEMLEANSHLSELENDFDMFSFAIYRLTDKQSKISKDQEHLFTLEYVIEELKRLVFKHCE